MRRMFFTLIVGLLAGCVAGLFFADIRPRISHMTGRIVW